MTKMKKMLLVTFACSLFFASYGFGAELDAYHFLKIAAEDQRAVMKTPEGTLQVVSVGAVIAEEAKITEIADGRIVLQRQDSKGAETIIIRLAGNRQRIERYRQSAEAPSMPMVSAQVTGSDVPAAPPVSLPAHEEKKTK